MTKRRVTIAVVFTLLLGFVVTGVGSAASAETPPDEGTTVDTGTTDSTTGESTECEGFFCYIEKVVDWLFGPDGFFGSSDSDSTDGTDGTTEEGGSTFRDIITRIFEFIRGILDRIFGGDEAPSDSTTTDSTTS